MSDKITNIGTKFSVVAGVPATENIAGYAALTWVKVAKVTSVPEMGGSASLLTQPILETGVVLKAHGEINYGGGTLLCSPSPLDPGQVVLTSAAANQTTLSFKVERPNGRIEYTQGIVMGAVTPEATSGATNAVNFDVQYSAQIVRDDASV